MSFRRNHIIALTLTAILIITNQVIIQYFLAQKRYDARVINVGGKQRMLNQQLMGMVYDYHLKRDKQSKEDIRQNFEEWKLVHYGLINGNQQLEIKKVSEDIASQLKKINHNITYAEEILSKIDYLDSDDLEQFKINQNTFLMNMDSVVKSFEKASDRKLSTIIIIEIILVSLTLIVLCGEVFWVFVPALRQLTRQNKMLEENNKTLEDYAFIASHDLRAPIANIIGSSRLLEKKAAHKLDKKELQYLDFIKDGAKRMNDTTKDLLAYAMAGKVKKGEVNFSQLVQEVVVDIQTKHQNKGDIKVGQLPRNILADKVLIKLLFTNLISNAIKFVPNDRQPQVEISSRKQKSAYIFKIKDNGIGIADADKHKIFGIFKRLHNKSKYEGTGTGLALCKRIVEGHQGDIWVQSTEGKGSTFCFTIPV